LISTNLSMRTCFFLFLVLLAMSGFAQQHTDRTDSLLNVLDETIARREGYLKTKTDRIASLTEAAVHATAEKQFNAYLAIYDEYKSFIYDSAFRYAHKLQKVAYQLKDPQKISIARIKLAFVLVSSGLFKEAIDTLQHINTRGLTDSVRGDYFYLYARTCYDLADFNRDDFYSPQYGNQGNALMDSAMRLTKPGSARYLLLTGLKQVRMRDMAAAKAAFEEMIYKRKISDQDFAVATSTLSFIYFYSNEPVKSKEMLILAAISDIRSSTKETLATLNLADMLYKQGNVEKAYEYVKIALDDANFYGARHRKVQVAAVYPIIESKHFNLVESKRKMLLLYASVITLLTIMTVLFAIIIYKQFQKLQVAKRTISEANDILTETNHQLVDANKIKEEYIWYYFSTTADYITKLDSLKRSLELKLTMKKLEDLRFTVDSINIKKEREDLYHNFDKVFLKLFPDFVTTFNSFFKDEDRIVVKDDHLMNTELRIFALVRMGIHDNEKIAKILDYSVTTIYTYKTRLRNKSTLPNEEFDKAIMSIRAI
jgi:predicted negative regulator of RcsB-dependent stress response